MAAALLEATPCGADGRVQVVLTVFFPPRRAWAPPPGTAVGFASLRSRRGASLRNFSCLSLKTFSSLARDDHLPKSPTIIRCLLVSGSSKESPDCVEADETGAARLLGSGRPRSGRSASRDMGPKGRSSRKNFVSGSTYPVPPRRATHARRTLGCTRGHGSCKFGLCPKDSTQLCVCLKPRFFYAVR